MERFSAKTYLVIENQDRYLIFCPAKSLENLAMISDFMIIFGTVIENDDQKLAPIQESWLLLAPKLKIMIILGNDSIFSWFYERRWSSLVPRHKTNPVVSKEDDTTQQLYCNYITVLITSFSFRLKTKYTLFLL